MLNGKVVTFAEMCVMLAFEDLSPLLLLGHWDSLTKVESSNKERRHSFDDADDVFPFDECMSQPQHPT